MEGWTHEVAIERLKLRIARLRGALEQVVELGNGCAGSPGYRASAAMEEALEIAEKALKEEA